MTATESVNRRPLAGRVRLGRAHPQTPAALHSIRDPSSATLSVWSLAESDREAGVNRTHAYRTSLPRRESAYEPWRVVPARDQTALAHEGAQRMHTARPPS